MRQSERHMTYCLKRMLALQKSDNIGCTCSVSPTGSVVY